MAYLRSIIRICYKYNCDSIATVELFNKDNGSHGLYCQIHGNERLRVINVAEHESYPVRGPDRITCTKCYGYKRVEWTCSRCKNTGWEPTMRTLLRRKSGR